MTKIFKWFVDKIKKFIKFAFNKPNPKENIIQYTFRQFLLPDSQGNPSYTITILVYCMALVGYLAYAEIHVGLSEIVTKDAQGAVVTQLHGISDTFIYLMTLLVGMIVYFFKKRGDKIANQSTPDESEQKEPESNETGDQSIISAAVEKIKGIINK